MVGHYLLSLTPEQESRILVGRVVPMFGVEFGTSPKGSCGCLMMTAHGVASWDLVPGAYDQRALPGLRYEGLCERFGVERINAAIRNRILSNQARRALAGVRELVET